MHVISSTTSKLDFEERVKKYIAPLLIAILPLSNAGAAEISYIEDPKQSVITIAGKIDADSPAKLKMAIQAADAAFAIKPRLIVYRINSGGGNLNSALEMGRMMRNAPFLPAVEVGSSDQCLSSCVFLVAAGVYRDVDGRIGIHRPFLENDQADSIAKQRAQSERLERNVKQYLENMGVSTTLFDAMNRIPSSEIRYLTKDQLENYGLNTDDPHNNSAVQARLAASLGITSGELVRREQRADSECQHPSKEKRIACRANIIVGK